MDSRASSVDIFDTLAVPYVISARRPDLLRLPTRHGLLQVLALPYPVRQRLLTQDQFRKMGSEELDQTLAGLMVDLLNQLAGRLDPEAPTVVAGHFSVQNAHWGSERNIMVGRDVTLPMSALVDSRWDYVALGHIHQHQNLNPTNDPPVIYPGSLERVDFGEEKQPKGFVWVELQRGKAEWKFVKLPARPFRTIRVDVQEIENPLRMVQQMLELDREAIQGAVVRLVVQLRPEQEPLLRDAALMPFLKEAFFAQINREVARTARDRLDGLEPERMTPESLLERYLTARGKTEAEIGEYQALAQTLFQDEDQEI
jgi:exonuclease SbcD